MKTFEKLLKKQKKELEAIRKKHLKDKSTIQRLQCQAVEKYIKNHRKNGDLTKDENFLEQVRQQAKNWSDLQAKCKNDEWELIKQQATKQSEVLEKFLAISQMEQIKRMEQKFMKEDKEMRSKQAKISVDTAKEVASDRTLRNKAERERRLREKNSNNTKKFIEERKASAMKQAKELQKVKSEHEKQKNRIISEGEQIIQLYQNAEKEFKLAGKTEHYI